MRSRFEQIQILPQLARWLAISLVIGILAGTASAGFLVSLEWATSWREAHVWIIAAVVCPSFLRHLCRMRLIGKPAFEVPPEIAAEWRAADLGTALDELTAAATAPISITERWLELNPCVMATITASPAAMMSETIGKPEVLRMSSSLP